MPRETRKLLEDIILAARAIQEFTQGKTQEDFLSDLQLQSAVYFQFVIIGEAMTTLREEEERLYDAISENFRIVGFRNQIVHGYFNLDHDVTWRTILSKLPTLIDEVTAMQ